MKKHLFITTVASGLLLCNNIYADEIKPVLSDSKILGYAYMQGGTKLLKVSLDTEKPDENVEVIRITEYGFYPNYSMSTKQLDGDSIPCEARSSRNIEMGIAALCDSFYTTRSTGNVVTSGLTNVIGTGLFLGLNLAAGLVADNQSFDKALFLKGVEDNGLQKYRTELLENRKQKQEAANYLAQKNKELADYANQKSHDIDAFYSKAFSNYDDNRNLISLSYTVNDKSGLVQDKNLNGDYSVDLNAPKEKSYDYTPFVKAETLTKENALSKVASIKEKIDQQYQKDTAEYKKYLSTQFKNYTLSGSSEQTFTHNDNIAFDATIKAPAEVAYTLGKKINIAIPITVESASLNNMVPKEYLLDDSNFIAVMGANSDLTVNGVLSNKTQSFITVKSLTCYYQNLVNNLSNLDKELAPESKDLDDGTQYGLLSSTMKEKSNFEKITKSKADSIKIKYGYAVKYKVNDTNIEKAIYTTKSYSLYDIYRQYL